MPISPTLEIFTCDQIEPRSPTAANRPGYNYGHVSFEVEEVAANLRKGLGAGGRGRRGLHSHDIDRGKV